MIVRILSAGKSFKGLATYLTHDPEAKTEERVGWTHTLNLAHDDPRSAVDEMLWTARYAELLKQEAGIRAGGRATENAVKHLSLNWSPDDDPTRDHMLETTEAFLRHMKWDEHQALLVAHDDKAFAHVHVMLNVVHPETGLCLDDGFERRRAQAWALEYEQEQGNIRCENRLRDYGDREDAPTRPAWMAFQSVEKNFDDNEKPLAAQKIDFERAPENPLSTEAGEWELLKKLQREERLEFFAEGKQAFSELRLSICREVREEFRLQWAEYFAAEKNGCEPEALKEMKAALLVEQKAVLEERRDEACDALRDLRNDYYHELLDGQRDMRHSLHARQDAGLNSLELMDHFRTEISTNTNDALLALVDSRREDAAAQDGRIQPEAVEERSAFDGRDSSNMRSGSEIGLNIGMGLAFGFMSLFESLADGLIHAKPDPKPKHVEPEFRHDLFDFAAEQSRQQNARQMELEAEEEARRARSQ